MATIKEEVMTVKDDCQYVRALDANGNSIRISKEDLAKVLGELLHIDDTLIRYDASWVYDMNDMTEPGYYSVNKDETNGKNYPTDVKYGGLVVFAVRNGHWLLQICFSVYGLVYTRTRTENEMGWSEWKKL